MIRGPVRDSEWSRLSEFIAENIGLHFPAERRDDLERGFDGAAREFGFDDSAACVGWLLSMPPDPARLQVLASHLTIGETYFFRDPQAMAALAERILPEAIRGRRGREQRLRVWSAACCSGEEAYTLAILLHQALPDLREWKITITATDINPRFLQKAVAGVYGEWSFRNVPAGTRQRYFERVANGRFAVVPEIRAMVSFGQLNLVDDHYPSLATDTNAMDLILCRNVLMYFLPHQIRRVASRMHRALVDGGWLLVSPSEASRAWFPEYRVVNFPGAIAFRKDTLAPEAETVRHEPEAAAPWPMPATPWPIPAFDPAPDPAPDPTPAAPDPGFAAAGAPQGAPAIAEAHFRQGHYAQAADTLLAGFGEHEPGSAEYSLLCRALANQGDLVAAQAWCDRWVAACKLEPAGHYLRAVVLLERGELEEARLCLQRAIYLRADFVLAHFALGNLARTRGRADEARRHFANTLRLLREVPPDEELPEGDGLTAARLAELVESLAALGREA